jgi:hypothetical protein
MRPCFSWPFASASSFRSRRPSTASWPAALHANSVVAALISFSVGTAVLGIAAFARGGLGERWRRCRQQPLWKLTGGMLGAAFVFGTVFLAPRIGLLNLVVLVIAGPAAHVDGDRPLRPRQRGGAQGVDGAHGRGRWS